jgi:hypothetical protein
MVNIKLTKIKPGHRCSLCGKRFPTMDEWNEHTIQCAREFREKLTFEYAECDYVTKRKQDIKRHAETHYRADNREKAWSEVDDVGKDPGDLHELIGLVNPSRKSLGAGKKEKKANDPSVFEPFSRKICRITQGDSPNTSKSQSKSEAGDRRKLASTDKEKATKTVSASTQTQIQVSNGQIVSTAVQMEETDSCECEIHTSPVKRTFIRP